MKDGPFKKTAGTLVRLGMSALGTALGGPAGGILGNVLGNVLGVGNDDDAIDKALANATPETIAKIKEMEANVAINENSEATERLRIDTGSQSWLSQNIRPVVTVSLLVLFAIYNFGATIAVAAHYMRTGQIDSALTGFIVNIGMQFGVLLTAAIGFYFGGRAAEYIKWGKPRDRK